MKTLFALGFVVVLSATSCSSQQAPKDKTSMNTQEKEVIQDVEANYFHDHYAEGQLLDVRTPEEYAEGHIANALNLNYYDSDFMNQVAKLDKNKPVYIYCRSGKRSASAAQDLKSLGFKEIYNLLGGFSEYSYK